MLSTLLRTATSHDQERDCNLKKRSHLMGLTLSQLVFACGHLGQDLLSSTHIGCPSQDVILLLHHPHRLCCYYCFKWEYSPRTSGPPFFKASTFFLKHFRLHPCSPNHMFHGLQSAGLRSKSRGFLFFYFFYDVNHTHIINVANSCELKHLEGI